jgi:hypothetical protein
MQAETGGKQEENRKKTGTMTCYFCEDHQISY